MDEQKMMRILSAREERWQRRMELAQLCDTLVSVSLCVPYEYRIKEKAKSLLRSGSDLIENVLNSKGFEVRGREELDTADGLTVYLMSCGGEELKRACIELEEKLPYGRIFDIDITAKTPISRSDLRLPPRKCFVCGNDAKLCSASSRHGREEIGAYLEKLGL